MPRGFGEGNDDHRIGRFHPHRLPFVIRRPPPGLILTVVKLLQYFLMESHCRCMHIRDVVTYSLLMWEFHIRIIVLLLIHIGSICYLLLSGHRRW